MAISIAPSIASLPILRTLMAGSLTLLLSACASLSSQSAKSYLEPPEPPELPEQWQSEVPVASENLSEQLLDLFDQPQLRQLVEQTLAANLDLRQTALRLQQQQLAIRQRDADKLPQLELNLRSQRQQQHQQTSNNHRLSLDLSWEADVWGRLADASRAAELEQQALSQDLQAARDSLVARVMQRWIDISLRQQVTRTERDWLASLADTEAVIRDRYRSGLGGLADLEAARAATARVRASLAAREQRQRDAYRQLALLQGTISTQALPVIVAVPTITNPPNRLPAQWLAHRPDLRAAYQRILVADAEAAVARKRLLPSFSFSADLSQQRPAVADLLSGSSAWSLLGQLTAPLFNAGRLKAGAEIAELQTEQRYLAYQQTLLTALDEVEAALGQEASLARQQQHRQAALGHAQASLAHYQGRYRDGVGDILDLLNAKQSAFSAQIELLQTQQARLTNRVGLGLALGMGV